MKPYLSILILFVLFGCDTKQVITLEPVHAPFSTKEVRTVQKQKPTNVILMIGDGMGLTQISAGMYSNDNSTALERCKVIGLQKTHAFDNLVTDSAASATAFSCGVKTYNAAIGVDQDTMPVKSILKYAQDRNMPTGLVASSTIVHATPACFYSNNKFRKNYEEIASDLVNSGVDFFVGGGKKFFDRREMDDRNLMDELKANDYMVSHFAEEELDAMSVDVNKKFGYLTADKDPIPVSGGRDYMIPASDMALDYLSEKGGNDGFFLMIEGSQIDWGGHANLTSYVVSEFLEYDKIIDNVLDFAEADGNTLVVITADHETGGLAINPGSTMDTLVTQFTTPKHTGTMVPVFAYGPGAESFSGIYENTEIFEKLKALVVE